VRTAARLSIAGLAAALGGCAPSAYDKTRADAESWEAAKSHCTAAAGETPPGPLRQITMRHAFDECLKSRGWERNEITGVPHRHYRR
jgi:hypothetical protein